jgi:hypothetical protein
MFSIFLSGIHFALWMRKLFGEGGFGPDQVPSKWERVFEMQFGKNPVHVI